MTHHTANLRHLEGRQICLALVDGSRIDDCQLVSAGRRPPKTFWLFVNGADTFVSAADVVDVWEPHSHHPEAA